MPGPTPTLSHRVPLRRGRVRPLSTEFDYSADSDLVPYQNFQSAAVPRHQVHHVEESIKTCKLPKFACTHEAHMYKQATTPCVLRDPASKQQLITRPRQGQDDARGLITSQHANYSTQPSIKLSHGLIFFSNIL